MEKQMRKEHLAKSAKRWLAVILCLCLIGMMIPVTAMADDEGDFGTGNSLHWEFISETGTLTITGTGDMPDWGYEDDPPWYSLKSSIKKVIIGSGVTTIGKDAFLSCINLNEVELPNSLTKIGAAFANCSALTSITIPASVTEIDAQAFQGCTGLTTITLANNSQLGLIGDSAFKDCTALTTIIFECNELHGSFSGSPFAGCNNITTIRVPAGERGNLSFVNMAAALNNAQIVESIADSDLGWALDSNGTLTISGTGAMPNWSEGGAPWYSNWTSIKDVSIENGVTSIGNNAFYNCENLRDIAIPASVQTIGEDAFNGCTGLTTITFAGENPPTTIGDNAFSGCNISTINVPAGATDYESILTLPGFTNDAQIVASGSGNSGSSSSGKAYNGIGSFGADACYYDADTDSMDDGVKHITYGDAAYYPLFINGGSTPVTDRRMVEGLKIKAKYTEGEDLIEGEPQLVKVCVNGEYRYFIKFNVKQTLDAQLRDVCGTLTLNKSKKGDVRDVDYRVKDLTQDFDFEVGAEYNYADDTRLVIEDDPEIPLWPNEFFILKYDCDEEVEFEFGSDSNEGTFTVDVSGQGKNLITFNTEIDENIEKANPNAKMIAISFNNVRFNRSGVFNYEADDMNYAYEIKDGKLVKIAEFANGEVEFSTNTLGRYIFSDVELVSPETIGEAVFVREK